MQINIGIATPCYRGNWTIYTSDAIAQAAEHMRSNGIGVSEIRAAGSDVTQVWNLLLGIAKKEEFDAVLWVDGDVTFDAHLPMGLISSGLEYVSARLPIKKNRRVIWCHGKLSGEGRYRTTKTLGMGCLLMRSSVWKTVECGFYSKMGCGEDQSMLREWTARGNKAWVDMESIADHDEIPLPDRNDMSLHI